MDVFEKRGKSFLIGVKVWVLLMLLGFFAYVFLFEAPVPSSKLKKLSVGMTTSQVKTILGSPTGDLGRVSNGSGTFTHSGNLHVHSIGKLCGSFLTMMTITPALELRTAEYESFN